jgi:hypothetical protein
MITVEAQLAGRASFRTSAETMRQHTTKGSPVSPRQFVA